MGDASGHVDPISGVGIVYALWAGKIAAQVIKTNNLKSYDNRWREAFGKTFVERCKKKDAFYDPVQSTLSIFLGLINKTYSWSPT